MNLPIQPEAYCSEPHCRYKQGHKGSHSFEDDAPFASNIAPLIQQSLNRVEQELRGISKPYSEPKVEVYRAMSVKMFSEIAEPLRQALEQLSKPKEESALALLQEVRVAISDFKGHGMPGFTDRAAAYLILQKVDAFLEKP
jgi:hypothetical protein